MFSCVKAFTLWNLSKMPKTCYLIFTFFLHYSVNTVRVKWSRVVTAAAYIPCLFIQKEIQPKETKGRFVGKFSMKVVIIHVSSNWLDLGECLSLHANILPSALYLPPPQTPPPSKYGYFMCFVFWESANLRFLNVPAQNASVSESTDKRLQGII